MYKIKTILIWFSLLNFYTSDMFLKESQISSALDQLEVKIIKKWLQKGELLQFHYLYVDFWFFNEIDSNTLQQKKAGLLRENFREFFILYLTLDYKALHKGHGVYKKKIKKKPAQGQLCNLQNENAESLDQKSLISRQWQQVLNQVWGPVQSTGHMPVKPALILPSLILLDCDKKEHKIQGRQLVRSVPRSPLSAWKYSAFFVGSGKFLGWGDYLPPPTITFGIKDRNVSYLAP